MGAANNNNWDDVLRDPQPTERQVELFGCMERPCGWKVRSVFGSIG